MCMMRAGWCVCVAGARVIGWWWSWSGAGEGVGGDGIAGDDFEWITCKAGVVVVGVGVRGVVVVV